MRACEKKNMRESSSFQTCFSAPTKPCSGCAPPPPPRRKSSSCVVSEVELLASAYSKATTTITFLSRELAELAGGELASQAS